jgi:hypothetical protein
MRKQDKLSQNKLVPSKKEIHAEKERISDDAAVNSLCFFGFGVQSWSTGCKLGAFTGKLRTFTSELGTFAG